MKPGNFRYLIPTISSSHRLTLSMCYDRIGYEMTVLEGIPFDEQFHMIYPLSSSLCFHGDPHVANFLTRCASQEWPSEPSFPC